MPIVKTDFHGADARLLEAMLWGYVFQSGGYSGTILWESNSLIDADSENLCLTENARRRAEVFAGLRSGIPKLLQRCDERNSPVAVLYSHPSVNADFITAVADRWRSVAAWDPERYPAYACREAWWKLLEDRGLRPTFIHSGEVEDGELIARGVKLLVMPRAIAMGDAEADAIRDFVKAGGVVAADSSAGRMDAHCREREEGALDTLFGIQREDIDGYHTSSQRASFGWDEREPGQRPKWGDGPLRAECSLIEERIEPREGAILLGCAEYSDAPLGFYADHGEGKAVLLNAVPLGYLEDRRRAGAGRNFQKFFGHVVDLAGVEPLAEVLDDESGDAITGWRVWPFDHGAAHYFGIAPDLDITQDVLGAISGEGGGGQATPVRIRFSEAGHIYESRGGRYLGEGSSVTDTLTSTAARLYAVMPYVVQKMDLSFDGQVARAALIVADGQPGEHVFRFDRYDGQGKRDFDGGANVVAENGATEWAPDGPIPIGGKLVCRDVATGVFAEAEG